MAKRNKTKTVAISNGNANGWQQTEAGLQLQERLTSEHTILALTRLLDRIDGLEQTVQTLVTTIEQAPGFVSMVTDTVDEAYNQANQSGVDIEARLKAGLAMADKLTAPKTVAVLDKLLDRVDQVEQLVEIADQAPGMISMVADTADEAYRQAAASGVDIEARLKAGASLADKLLSRSDQLEQLMQMADQAPGMISMVADIADESYRQAAQSGVDIETRLQAGLAITEKLTAPETMEVLSALLDRTDKLGQAVELIDQGPGLAAMAMDTLDEAYRQALTAGIDIDSLVSQGLNLSAILANFVSSKEFQSLQHSGVLDPKVLQVVGSAGQALATTQQQPIKQVGILDLFRAIGDPDTQRALGFLLAFGKNFGQSISR